MITSVGLNLVEHVYVLVKLVSVLHVLHVEPIFVLPIQIAIPLHTFKQHLLEIFLKPKVRKMEIDETLFQIKVQNLCITR